MGVVVRQSIKSTLITLFGALLGVVVTVLSMRYFPKIDYGFTQNLQKVATLLSFATLYGFNYAVLIQSQKYPPGHPQRAGFLTLCALIPIAFTLLITALLFLFKGNLIALYNSEDRVMMAKLFIAIPLLNLLTVGISWLSGYLQAVQKNALQSFGMEVLLRIGYILMILLYAFNWVNFNQFIYGFLIANLIPVIYLYWIARRLGKLRFSLKINLSKTEIKETFRFSGYHMLMAISSVLIFQLDALLLGVFPEGGLEAIAVYSVASLAVSLLRNPTRVIGGTVIPTFSQSYLAADLKGLNKLFQKSCVIMQIFGFGTFALIILDIDFIQKVVLFVNDGYGAIKWLLPILMIGQVADIATGFNYQVISISKYYRFNFWISIFLLVVVFVLNYFLIQDFGIYGAAWATTIGLILFNWGKSWFLWRKLKMQPFSKKSFVTLFITIAAFIIAWSAAHTGFYYVDLILKNLLFAGLFLGLILKLKISEEINQIAHNLLRRKKLF